MKLYCFPVAPNPTKVRLFLAEKAAAGRPLNVEEVTVSLPEGEQNAAEHAARNPFKRLPVLELDDGSYILESLAMIEYLDELFPEPSLIGRTARERDCRLLTLRALRSVRELSPSRRPSSSKERQR